MKYFLSLVSCVVNLHLSAGSPPSGEIVVDEQLSSECYNESCGRKFDPYSPLINCSYLPLHYMTCQDPMFLDGNSTARANLGYGCTKWGGQKYGDVERSRVWCQVLHGIECYGNREFLSFNDFPCIQYSGHYFVTTLIYSVLLGFLGMDRFCLGLTGTAVGKLLTLGGVGIWWIVDVILLVTGELRPSDDSNWVPYY